MTVIVIILILATMSLQAYSLLRARAERANCVTNLRSLYTAANSYLIDHDSIWPQVSPTLMHTPAYALAWINTLAPYQLGRVNWICPTTQRIMGNPDFMNDDNARVDYIGSPFTTQPTVAYKWSTQPWFSEIGDAHGDGNMMVLTNGQTISLNEFIRESHQ